MATGSWNGNGLGIHNQIRCFKLGWVRQDSQASKDPKMGEKKETDADLKTLSSRKVHVFWQHTFTSCGQRDFVCLRRGCECDA